MWYVCVRASRDKDAQDKTTPSNVHCPVSSVLRTAGGNKFADQLYEDLLYNYNPNVFPLKNATGVLKTNFGSSLIRIVGLVSFITIYRPNLPNRNLTRLSSL